MFRNILFLIFAILPTILSGQIVTGGATYEEKVDPSKIEPWITNQNNDYQGFYHFGFSDGEFNFVLIVTKDTCYGQIQKSFWAKNGDKYYRKPSFTNLKNVKINGNKFSSNETNGEFVIYNCDCKNKKGLIVYNPWRTLSKQGLSDYGFYSSPLQIYFEGKFPESSFRLLDEAEIEKMTIPDLKIMVAEIYARHGYLFETDSEMDKYFKPQKWYFGINDNVDSLFSGLERRNYNLINSQIKLKQKEKGINDKQILQNINGHKLFVKDSSQYSAPFIKELRWISPGYDSIILINDSMFVSNYNRTNAYQLTKELPLNKTVLYKSNDEKYFLKLKKANFTEIDFEFLIDHKLISAGETHLQGTFFFGAGECFNEVTGERYYTHEYLSKNYTEKPDVKEKSDPTYDITLQVGSGERVVFFQQLNHDKSTNISVGLRRIHE